MTTEQLTLSIQLEPQLTFENTIIGSNAALLELCQQLPHEAYRYLYLWGHHVGCSHLLQACCHHFIEQGLTAFYFSFQQLASYQPDILNGLEMVDCLCLDDVQLIAGQRAWQEALFHLYNRQQALEKQLIIAGNAPPRQLKLELADLQSRLASGLIFQVNELSDPDKQAALILQAKLRGLSLSLEVAQYILNHGERDMSTLIQLLDELDNASLSSQRKLTIPFVKQQLNW